MEYTTASSCLLVTLDQLLITVNHRMLAKLNNKKHIHSMMCKCTLTTVVFAPYSPQRHYSAPLLEPHQ